MLHECCQNMHEVASIHKTFTRTEASTKRARYPFQEPRLFYIWMSQNSLSTASDIRLEAKGVVLHRDRNLINQLPTKRSANLDFSAIRWVNINSNRRALLARGLRASHCRQRCQRNSAARSVAPCGQFCPLGTRCRLQQCHRQRASQN